jgi:kynurenine/2-aminoadipate aminotransferase
MLSVMDPYQPNYIVVETDKGGMIPDKLREALKAAAVPPNVMYINPACNPSGSVLSLERKKEIYTICCEHDILILEDDPYFFMQYCERVPSFLSLDTEARVLRFDSFSKILVRNSANLCTCRTIHMYLTEFVISKPFWRYKAKCLNVYTNS